MEHVENNVIELPTTAVVNPYEIAKTFTLKLDESDWEELDCWADEFDLTVEQLIESILTESL